MSWIRKFSIMLCLALVMSLAGWIKPARAITPGQTCDQLNGLTDTEVSGIDIGGFSVTYKPGQQLLITVARNATFGAGWLHIAGAGAPGNIFDLPYTFNYE